MLGAGPFERVLSYIPHELGLQPLCTSLTAYVESAFFLCNLFVPRAQVKQRAVIFTKGCPHQPPAVGGAFLHPTVGASTSIEGICYRLVRGSNVHYTTPRGSENVRTGVQTL